jgi:16S rRNA (adenine1518-N6/adenine1519-N6)-dimethyltransferase
MVPLGNDRPAPKDSHFFEQVVARAFAQRRKMLRRGLGEWAALVDWDALGIPNTARAEELSVGQFMGLADNLMDAGVYPKNQ